MRRVSHHRNAQCRIQSVQDMHKTCRTAIINANLTPINANISDTANNKEHAWRHRHLNLITEPRIACRTKLGDVKHGRNSGVISQILPDSVRRWSTLSLQLLLVWLIKQSSRLYIWGAISKSFLDPKPWLVSTDVTLERHSCLPLSLCGDQLETSSYWPV